MSERYESVREKLVQRGYLQGRLERFLLRDLLAATAPRALALTSVRAAIVGAPLVGGLLAASTVAANRPAGCGEILTAVREAEQIHETGTRNDSLHVHAAVNPRQLRDERQFPRGACGEIRVPALGGRRNEAATHIVE